MGIEWFYIDDEDEECGPFSPGEIKDLATVGKIEADTLLWRDGLDEWVEAEKVNGLQDFLQKNSRPPRHVNSNSKYCSNCGSALNNGAAVCLKCGASAYANRSNTSGSNNRVFPSSPPKDPVFMAVLSGCCFVGLGQVVLGQEMKGVMIMVITVFVLLVMDRLHDHFGILSLIPLVWMLSSLDAYLIACKLRNGQDVGLWEFF